MSRRLFFDIARRPRASRCAAVEGATSPRRSQRPLESRGSPGRRSQSRPRRASRGFARTWDLRTSAIRRRLQPRRRGRASQGCPPRRLSGRALRAPYQRGRVQAPPSSVAGGRSGCLPRAAMGLLGHRTAARSQSGCPAMVLDTPIAFDSDAPGAVDGDAGSYLDELLDSVSPVAAGDAELEAVEAVELAGPHLRLSGAI